VIVRAQGDSDKVDVLIGNLRVKVPLNELEQVNGNRLKHTESKEDVLFTPLTTGMTGKINLVGMRVMMLYPWLIRL